MSDRDDSPGGDREAEIRRLATQRREGLLSEFLQYLQATRKWWLLPILLALLLLGFLLLATSTPWGLLIYPI